jgi:hypothetical protein
MQNIITLITTTLLLSAVKAENGDICGLQLKDHLEYYNCTNTTEPWSGPDMPGFFGALDVKTVN